MTLPTLLRIKRLRVERAEQALQRQELRVGEAQRLHQTTLADHKQYRQWRQAQETRLFEQCKAQPINRKTLEQWQQQVARLREKEAALEQTIAEQAKTLAQERERLRLSRRQLQEAQQQVAKFNELNAHALAEALMLLEFKEEQELEEFRRTEAAS
ncbi:type III secretion system stalk subunit SctO [Pseudomonas gessardii]|uniref:type III secretion system stalk subunit SctO n=1 Tax=Pseudomonas gessardii TaxID=78544 RepID=UPI0014745187|nr:YscO family type III secretion system apparatus protein [Pseudomonas gessardii]NNA67861.1 YscO family type III secretion system apparatus protein [Pseudomonas gessardii]